MHARLAPAAFAAIAATLLWAGCSGSSSDPGPSCDAVPETCNGLDDDCDGLVDEDFTTKGDACSAGFGACVAAGVMTCAGDGSGVVCDAVPGTPSPELCNGVDDDCDPETADGTDEATLGAPCDGPDADLCTEGSVACTGGVLGCTDATGDALELCDGIDNDCVPATADGADEPTFGAACDGPDADLCNEGTVACVAAQLLCSDATGHTLDLCNGDDDDCNPATPDGADEPTFGAACDGSDADLCNEGTVACVAAQLLCGDATGDASEICNGADDDCDGQADEELLGLFCPLQAGVCAGSRLACGGVEGWLACTAASYGAGYEVTETLCDGLDNDCDGTVDEVPPIACYDGPPATLGVGACAAGAATCVSGEYGACVGQVLPTAELCDDLDNDCSGVTDDPFTLGGSVTLTELDGTTGGVKGQSCGLGACAGGTVVCTASGLALTCTTWSAATSEACTDGVDNDCDGLADAADPDCPWSHTVAIDGVNDFGAEEQFETTSLGYTGWITWDATHLYVAYQGDDVASGSLAKWLLVYLEGTGTGTGTGVIYNTQQPNLPFAATHHARIRLDWTYSNLMRFGEGAWVDAGAPPVEVAHSGTFMELRIPLASLGSPATVGVHVSMIDETPFAERTLGGIPGTSFTDGYDPVYGHYLQFDLAGRDAPGSYPPQ